jgi:hypothetical protein
MGSVAETVPGRRQPLRSASLRKPVSLRWRDSKISLEGDGAVRYLESCKESRAVFGFERFWLYKLQAGVVVQAQKPDWGVRATPSSVRLACRAFEGVEVTQSVGFFHGASSGYVRRVRLRNAGAAAARLRVIDLSDPSASQMGDPAVPWGSLGLNAFNRSSHVVLDEASDPPSARVVGALPAPARFYMTTGRSRAQDLVAAGELPEATAGMSGQVIIMSQHDLDLPPGSSIDLSFASIYSPSRLEDALADFGRVQAGEDPQGGAPSFACSSPMVTDAASWAAAALEGSRFSADPLDRYECLGTLSLLSPQASSEIIAAAKAQVRRDGSAPHSLDPLRGGVLETAVLLEGISKRLLAAQDKKLSRSLYPLAKKLAKYLVSESRGNRVVTDPSLPQGWRRALGRGHPTGEIPEVTMAVAAGLRWASEVARHLSKADDAGKFRERSALLSEDVRKRLVDERGLLASCIDSGGKLRIEDSVDMAVANYRMAVPPSDQASIHRLMEKDFETAYGPRCVPSSNQVYFHRTYGQGQLGSVWTRAALAHAVSCYRAGLAGIGGLAVQRVARLVAEDGVGLGGAPGEFPYWVDPDGRESHGGDSDPVAASRFLEALIFGEFGLQLGAGGLSLSPPPVSSFAWAGWAGILAGGPASVFVGRGKGGAHTFAAKPVGRGSFAFSAGEPVEAPGGVFGLAFSVPGQVVCLGNSSDYQVRGSVGFRPRAPDLARRLSTPLEAFDPDDGSWSKVGSLKVGPLMSFEASLGPGEWKALRIST